MAVISMMRISGDSDDLAGKIREHLGPVGREVAPGLGGLGTIVCKTDDGILVINLWENDEGRHQMAADPRVQQSIQASGFPQPAFEGYEVLDMPILPAAVRG